MQRIFVYLRSMKRWLLFLLPLALLGACAKNHYPRTPFQAAAVPPAPDYSNRAHWAALPDRRDAADSLPGPGLADGQATATADVFFIHPTTFNSAKGWNGALEDEKLNSETDRWPIRHQASVFNGSCRVFAPRYRQATLGAFYQSDLQSRQQALALAYEDVKAAFEYYLSHENQGRPIIIASHSQGTVHAVRLVKEYFDGKPLSKQLVAAYLVGWALGPTEFAAITPCVDSTQTGCFVSWCTWAWGATENQDWYEHAFAVNPVSWRLDTAATPQQAHRGMVLRSFDRVRPALVQAAVHAGRLWVTKPDLPGKSLIHIQNYHVADYNLFWLDIRLNAACRVRSFPLKK